MASTCEPCFTTSKVNTATFKCTECEEVYCDKCAEYHVKYRVFRRHIVIPIEHSVDNNAKQSVASSQKVETEDNATASVVAEKNVIYSGSADLDAESKALYSGSTDLDVDKTQLYSGSDDLDAEKTVLYCGSDDLAEDSATIYAGSDVHIVAEEHVYDEADDTNQSTDHFYIDVKDSDLSRTIGIANCQCLLIVSKCDNSINVATDGAIKFECTLNFVRRHGYKSSEYIMEFGRRFQYGPGILTFNIKNKKELHKQLSDITCRKSDRK